MEDRLWGRLLLIACSTIFIYYTAWLLVTPFVEDEHFIASFFPAKRYAFLAPIFVGIALFCATLGNLAYVLVAAGLRQPVHSSDTNNFLGIEGPSPYDATTDVSTLLDITVPPESSVIECQVMIPVDIPANGLYLSMDTGNGSDGPSGRDLGAKVHHLPPLSLAVTMPPEYPSSKQPTFLLTGIWLSQSVQASVTKSLLGLWEEFGLGAPICYVWMDWLKSSLMESIGASERLVVCDLVEAEDEGTSSGGGDQVISAETILVRIFRYNATQQHQIFLQRTWTCMICMEEKLGQYFTQMPTCEHSFCSECFSEYCRVNIQDGQVDLSCLAYKCTTPIEPHLVRNAVSEDDYARWEKLTLQRALDKMKDVHYCPKCNFVILEETDHFAQCGRCFFAMCTRCNDSWHPGSKCIQDMVSQEDLAAVKTDTAADAQRRRINLVNQSLSRAVIQSSTTRCPGCNMAIVRSQGCNKMRCTYCYTTFCYKCGGEIGGYDHFWEQSKCKLFDEVEIRRWEMGQIMPAGHAAEVLERRNMRDVMVEEARENDRKVNYTKCPSCGQQNVKGGNNNHIRCWSCGLSHCYLCRTLLGRKVGFHFSRKTNSCKQHS